MRGISLSAAYSLDKPIPLVWARAILRVSEWQTSRQGRKRKAPPCESLRPRQRCNDPATSARRKPLPEHCASVGLVLQGGGALGAYQAGVYATLAEGGYEPDWIAGVSIGAINGALIAGNPPERRVERLRAFWELVTDGVPAKPAAGRRRGARLFNEWSALTSLASGVPGFFRPRVPSAWLQPWGTEGALSFYDTAPLRQTLEELVDFDLLNDGHPRLSVGAANIRKGNSVYFDTRERRLGPEHIMASAALPPGFPPVEIEGEHYWDGGVVTNTPLQYLLDARREASMLVFQVDLFSARGTLPRNLPDVYERQKDILYSSRTRLNTDIRARRPAPGAQWSACSRSCRQNSRTTPTCASSTRLALAACR